MATLLCNSGEQLTVTFSSMENGAITFTGANFDTFTPLPTGVILLTASSIKVPVGFIRKIS